MLIFKRITNTLIILYSHDLDSFEELVHNNIILYEYLSIFYNNNIINKNNANNGIVLLYNV
jgi:hypothetical protein